MQHAGAHLQISVTDYRHDRLQAMWHGIQYMYEQLEQYNYEVMRVRIGDLSDSIIHNTMKCRCFLRISSTEQCLPS
jgi:hypothetical protein